MQELFAEETPVSVYIEAVNDARFVKTFGIVSLLAAVLTCGPGVMLGVGLAVLGFGKTRYYRWLGLAVAVLGGAGFLLPPFLALAALVLGLGVLLKALSILRVLAREGQADSDWQATRQRALIGAVTGGLTILVGLLWLIYYSLVLLGAVAQGLQGRM
jgi:hypothetical protein